MCRPGQLGSCGGACWYQVQGGVPGALLPDIHTAAVLPAANTSARDGWGKQADNLLASLA